MKSPRIHLGAACSALLIASVCSSTSIAAEAKKQGKKADESDKLFAGSDIPRIEIEISPEDLGKLRKHHWQFGAQHSR